MVTDKRWIPYIPAYLYPLFKLPSCHLIFNKYFPTTPQSLFSCICPVHTLWWSRCQTPRRIDPTLHRPLDPLLPPWYLFHCNIFPWRFLPRYSSPPWCPRCYILPGILPSDWHNHSLDVLISAPMPAHSPPPQGLSRRRGGPCGFIIFHCCCFYCTSITHCTILVGFLQSLW